MVGFPRILRAYPVRQRKGSNTLMRFVGLDMKSVASGISWDVDHLLHKDFTFVSDCERCTMLNQDFVEVTLSQADFPSRKE